VQIANIENIKLSYKYHKKNENFKKSSATKNGEFIYNRFTPTL
jgi:hypothetical protein